MRLILNKFFLTLLLLCAVISSQAVKAQSSEPERYTKVSIKPAHTSVGPSEELDVAIVIDLAPHWHVYWANPGDSGLPVGITWTMPDGFSANTISWPVPDKISYDILSNYGYYDQAVLIQSLKLPDTLPEGVITLSAKVDMLVCNEICVPESQTIDVRLNDPENLSEDNTVLIKKAEEKLPREMKGEFTFGEADGQFIMDFHPEDRTLISGMDSNIFEFFPLDWGIINHNEMPVVRLEDGVLNLTHVRGEQKLEGKTQIDGLLVQKGEIGKNIGYAVSLKPGDAVTQRAVINKTGEEAAQASDVVLESSDAQKSVAQDKMTILSALLFAFLGGLVLNLMPCVFPVLSMKALSLVKMAEKDVRIARIHGIAYTVGVILSFLAIGGALVALKQAGAVIGWGFQLQNPMVVGALAYLLFALGLNLMGFFEFGTRFANMGGKLTAKSGLTGSFFTGVLATLVATPCTAPFMGAAMGFALVQTPAISLLIFAALGFGLALPYLLLAYLPPLRKILPRPGPWMSVFKQLLAFPMFASAIWLVWVVGEQIGVNGIFQVLLGMISIAFAVWLIHLQVLYGKRLWLSIIIGFFVALPFIILPQRDYVGTGEFKSEEFSQEALNKALEGDEPVFVEMTAAWCITCKINHAIAINVESTKKLFSEKKIRYFIGDWTNSKAEITSYLEAFNRNGVPLYIYYGPREKHSGKRPDPKILPQVLTPSIVEQELRD